MATKICRTCLQVLSSEANCLSLDIDDSTFDHPSVRSKLLTCVPEIALDAVDCAVICTSCSDALNAAYNFKNKCLQTEERILNYTQYTGCSTNSVDIFEVVQFSELNSESNSMEQTQQLIDAHYPITQIIERDSEIDIKPIILENNASKCTSAASQPYLYETEIVNVMNIKTETNQINSEATNSELEKRFLTHLPFSPELDVEVRSYKINSMDPLFQNSNFVLNNNASSVEYLRDCTYCQKSFNTPGELEAHLLTHMENRPLKCTMCDRRFVRKDKLMLHMRIHTGEKPFECTTCGRCFSRKDKLNNHMRTHTGEKPHQCILCQKSFARKDKMNTHMKSQHWLALANLEITVVKTAPNSNIVESNLSENVPNE